jgi:ABC-2 type transport system ATP-binding protein
MFLEFDKISFSYPEVLALDCISFKVARGEIVGLIGANGAGKTTAILHIIRYLNPKSGKIRMDGVDIPDTPVFYEELTLLEHLHFLKALYPDNKLSIDEIIDKLEILDHLHKVPSALSKGTKQKLMIALALLRRYELLIADEPFSGLDPKQIGIFRQVLEECRQEQKAVLLSTHLLDMVDGTCDRYIMLHRGKLIAIGTKQDIIQRNALDPDSTLEQVYLTLVGKEI